MLAGMFEKNPDSTPNENEKKKTENTSRNILIQFNSIQFNLFPNVYN